MTSAVTNNLPSLETNDNELVDLIKTAPQSEIVQLATKILFERYAKLLYSYARTRGLDSQDSEDVVQLTLLKMYNSVQNFDPNKFSLRAWLFAIINGKMHDLYRSRRMKHIPEINLDNIDALKEVIDEQNSGFEQHTEETDVVNNLLSELDEKSRQVTQFILQGFTISEIAQKMNLTSSEVYSKLASARKKMQALTVVSRSKD